MAAGRDAVSTHGSDHGGRAARIVSHVALDATMMLSRNCVELERLIGRVRFGRGGSLVVRGDAGAGKTTLLGHSLDFATGCRVIRVAGVEAESELPFAAIERLCEQIWDGLDRLPDPQADALKSALGLTTAGEPDSLLVGLAVRSLLHRGSRPSATGLPAR